MNAVESMVAGKLGPSAESTYPDTYAGIVANPETHSVTLYFTPGSIPAPDSPNRNALIEESTLSSEQVKFDASPFSRAQLKSVIQKVVADRETIKSLGIEIPVASIDLATRKVRLRVISPTASQAEVLRNRYGADLIEITPVTREETGQPLDRQNDFAPFNGGIFTTGRAPFIDGSQNGNQADCSLGFSTHAPNGGTYLVTAAHCFANNTEVYNKSALIPRETARTLVSYRTERLRTQG